MGKSDLFIFPEYIKILPKLNYDSVAFLGQASENQFTKNINSNVRHFYDLTLKNWQINSEWQLKQKYDLIVCTRCAYFSKDPNTFIEKCKSYLTPDGNALIDWGLGDHWRFKDYKVGWVRNGEQEFAYNQNNFLYSCFWNEDLLKDVQVQLFWKAIKENENFGYFNYKNLTSVINEEVPRLVSYECKKIKTKFLWPDNPQLYIITYF